VRPYPACPRVPAEETLRMDLLVGVALGLIQGLTEFLPVSSSGHLVLAQALFGLEVPGVLLELTAHLGTALAVTVLFARELGSMVGAAWRWLGRGRAGLRGEATVRADSAWRRLLANLILATGVTAAVGLAFRPLFLRSFETPDVAATMLLVTGLVLAVSARLGRGRRTEKDLGAADAVWVGAFQGLAILPGLSRSGLTIVGGLARRLSPQASARFSFLLSLPAIVGAALVEVLGEKGLAAALEGGVPVAGLATVFAASFFSGLLAMLVLVRVAASGRLHWFAGYCWLVGAAALVWLRLS